MREDAEGRPKTRPWPQTVSESTGRPAGIHTGPAQTDKAGVRGVGTPGEQGQVPLCLNRH